MCVCVPQTAAAVNVVVLTTCVVGKVSLSQHLGTGKNNQEPSSCAASEVKHMLREGVEMYGVSVGPSVFDLWVCGRPPAASEGVGPPRLKTKTSRKTAKNRPAREALRAADLMWGCVPTPILI